MLAIAFLVGAASCRIRAKKEGVDQEIIFSFLFLVFIWGIVGGRIFYVIENIGYYFKRPLEIVMLQHGGLSWFGGLIAGAISGIYYLKTKTLPVYKTLDLCVPFVALAQAIGRIGCLLNGCCFGKVSETGFYFPEHSAVLLPIQLYSSLALLLIFVVLRLLQDRPHRPGRIFFAYLLLYSLKRFLVEFWRADNPGILFGLTLFQLISALLFAVSLIKIILVDKLRD
jgi:phosphatidylglycerol:prolipoprotein diacylglycerol transferase